MELSSSTFHKTGDEMPRNERAAVMALDFDVASKRGVKERGIETRDREVIEQLKTRRNRIFKPYPPPSLAFFVD